VEKALRGDLGAVGAVAEFGDVQVDLQDAPLRQARLDQHRKIRLQPLAKIAAARPQEHILGNLLADRARAVDAVTVLVHLVGLFDGLDVKSPVLGKFLIFRCDDRQR